MNEYEVTFRISGEYVVDVSAFDEAGALRSAQYAVRRDFDRNMSVGEPRVRLVRATPAPGKGE